MTTYIVLLRGVNVAAQKKIKMEHLRGILAKQSFQNVRTYIQSGNVLLDSRISKPNTISEIVQTCIQEEYGFFVKVFTLLPRELQKVIRENPFLKEKNASDSDFYVTFLSEKPTSDSLTKLSGIKSGRDRILTKKTIMYLHCPGGYGKTKLSNSTIERVCSVEATTRNWNTVNELLKLALPVGK